MVELKNKDCKQNISILNQSKLKRKNDKIAHVKVEFIPGMQMWFYIYFKSIIIKFYCILMRKIIWSPQ